MEFGASRGKRETLQGRTLSAGQIIYRAWAGKEDRSTSNKIFKF